MNPTSRSIPWPRTLGAVALLFPAVIAFQPTFGGWGGYVAPLVGVLLGAAVAIIGHRLALRWSIRIGALLACYLLVGGPVVVPDSTIMGFVPTLDSISRLTLLTYQGWEDLLTVAVPAGDFSGPAAVPFLTGITAGALMAGLALGTTAVQLPLLVPVAYLGLAIAFGSRSAPHAVWLGAALAGGAMVWQVGHRLVHTRRANSSILLRKERGLSRAAATAVAAGLVIALGAGVSIGVNVAAGSRVNRQVLRDDVVPPLTLREYTSPLMKYRLYELTQKDEVLFEVRGMPGDTRLRLAVLETYDGNVYNVAQDAQQYLRSGRELPTVPTETPATAEVTVVGYDDVWLPTFGDSRRIEFTGEDARREARGLYFNTTSNQALTTARIAEGSVLRIDAVPITVLTTADREAIADAGIGSAPLGEVQRVPDTLSRAATDWTESATSAYDQLSRIAETLRADGFYSDGADGRSRSGHTTERLSTLLDSAQWIGDDEQYATAMALMASQLGIPTRVVLGFHPLDAAIPSDVWEVTGTQAHVWVEANLDGAGWVAFDPTPDRDKTPQTDVPQPKPKPKPQVDPPPDPPERLPDEIIVPDDDAANVDEEDQSDLGWLVTLLTWIGIGVGGSVLLAAPFVTILALKRRRARHRATRGDLSDQLVGAWDEVVDRARDLGVPYATTETRRETAARLAEAYPDVDVNPLAGRLDAALFSPAGPAEHLHEWAWASSKELRRGLLGTVPWYRRPAAALSLRSLRRRPTAAALRTPRRKPTPPTTTPVTPDPSRSTP